MAWFHSFLWLSNIPSYVCTTSSLSIHLSMGTGVASVSCVPLWYLSHSSVDLCCWSLATFLINQMWEQGVFWTLGHFLYIILTNFCNRLKSRLFSHTLCQQGNSPTAAEPGTWLQSALASEAGRPDSAPLSAIGSLWQPRSIVPVMCYLYLDTCCTLQSSGWLRCRARRW